MGMAHFVADWDGCEVRLDIAIPTPACTAAAAAIALDDRDDLLELVDEWLACELDWRWQGPDASPPASAMPAAVAEVAVAGASTAAAAAQCRLELPWMLMRKAGPPPRPLADRLRWQDVTARLTLATIALEPDELAALEPGGAVLLPDSMRAGWHAMLHVPHEPSDQGVAAAIGHPAAAVLPAEHVDREPATPETAGRLAFEVRMPIAKPLPPPLLAGWAGLGDALVDPIRQPVQGWLIDTGFGRSPRHLAGGRLIPWGSGWAMLLEEVFIAAADFESLNPQAA